MSLLSSIIPAAASLISSGANAVAGGKMNKRTRELTAEQNALNRKQTWDMWNATNEFNLKTSDPSFQMQRLKAAGINPWLAVGEPQQVKADTMQTQQFGPPNQERVPIDLDKAYAAFMQDRMNKKQMELIDKNIQSVDADISLKKSQAANLQTSTENTIQEMNQKARLFGGQMTRQGLENQGIANVNQKTLTEIQAIGKSMNKTDAEISNLQQNVRESLVRIDNLVKQGKSIEAETEAKRLLNDFTKSVQSSRIDAEKEKNKLIKDTKGLSTVGVQNIPGVLTGYITTIAEELVKGAKNLRKIKN